MSGLVYPPGLRYSHVLAGGLDRHADFVIKTMASINEARSTMRGVSSEVLRLQRDAVAWLIEALTQAEASLPAVPLSLPRSPTHYTSDIAVPVPHGYRVTTRALQALQALGWVEVRPGAETRGVTRIRSSGALQEHCRRLAHDWVPRPSRDASQLLFLTTKNSDGTKDRRQLRDGEDARIPGWRAKLQRINEFLRLQCIHLRAPDDQLVEFARAMAENRKRPGKKAPQLKLVQYAQTSLYRTFSGRLDLGGRFYGGWWQNVRSTMRPYIWINEWQAVECDFSGMAIRCLYAEEGLPVPDDPYDIGLHYIGHKDSRRDIVKEYINSIINDKEGTYWIGREALRTLGLTRKELERRVLEVHRGIAHHFHTDAGLRMQFVDSQIAERVMLKMMDIGAVCLPIHDSFMVQAPLAAVMVAVMKESFKEVTGAEAKWKGVDPGVVRHYEDIAFTPVQATDPAAVRERLEQEWERFSIANQYFVSWADQMWGEEGWTRAMAALDRAPDFLLPHHAFPLRLFYGG